MRHYSEVEINTIQSVLPLFRESGLEAVAFEDEKLKVIGGSKVKEAELGYELSEPEFAIFFENALWIAVIEDLDSIDDIDISAKFPEIIDAVNFICDTASKMLNKPSRKTA